jgi:hypothetical protein
MNRKARFMNGEIKTGLALLVMLAAGLMSSCGREGKLLRGGRAGVAVENNTELLVALPIENIGESDAHEVKVREVELRGGHRDVPVTLPVDLGTIAADGRTVIAVAVQRSRAGRFKELRIGSGRKVSRPT